MKKIIAVFMLGMMCLSGCKSNNENLKKIPLKETSNDISSSNSPINSHNLDEFMFREDVQYVDLRSSYMILQDGYVAGFEFIPFYSIIASFTSSKTLYRMKSVGDADPGHVGGFVAQYEESERIIKELFRQDKPIFLISQAGSESGYVINLLIQLGYDGNLLYNVGGVSNGEGIASYSSIKTNKYFVQGTGNLDVKVDYGFTDRLTPIN